MTTAPLRRNKTVAANHAWESSMTAHAVLMRRFAAQDVWESLSQREYDVLYTLSKADGPMRLTALSDNVLLSQPALSRMVDRLVSRGLVSRCADPGDARASHLSLTPDGVALQRSVGRKHGAAVAATMTAALSDDDLATLERINRTLISHAKKES
ncbi:MarR family winged helix-turn-helix transcriptional regulator [Demequina flava]|uniref:MarR family winged helix-turn-helix transcriptional regulator n=1 Tax=Demequina flava TaxID=1095025 RepID=UPI0007863D02|nr:MarR family transcriptional regulator [Demequina flava]